MSLGTLAEISRRYGSDPEWVLAGGGNTSFKDERLLFVKASGFPLATIGPDGFARMDRAKLAVMWDTTYPDASEEREAASLADAMSARVEGETKRPSVETLMHELFPHPYVVHTHPAIVNALSCAMNGELAARRLFGNELMWIPAIEPGLILARAMREAAAAHQASHGLFPRLVILQNHGLVIAGEKPEEIDAMHERVRAAITRSLTRTPDLAPAPVDDAARDRWSVAIAAAFEEDVSVEFVANAELTMRLASEEAFAPLSGAFTPDHIVYAGSAPLYVGPKPMNAAAALRSMLVAYRSEHGGYPRIIAAEGVGVFAAADSPGAAKTAMALFLDEVKIAAYAESFGGARHLDPHLVRFIEGWEVERYRKSVNKGSE